MEDFLKFLLIAGVILVGIFKEVNKNKAKKTANKRPSSTTPPTYTAIPDASPMPETWSRKTLDELLQPIFSEQPAAPAPPPVSKNKKKKEISIESSLANSLAQDKRNSKEGSQYDTPSQETKNEAEDYSIHTAEEARRAIIWGEILQRKY